MPKSLVQGDPVRAQILLGEELEENCEVSALEMPSLNLGLSAKMPVRHFVFSTC